MPKAPFWSPGPSNNNCRKVVCLLRENRVCMWLWLLFLLLRYWFYWFYKTTNNTKLRSRQKRKEFAWQREISTFHRTAVWKNECSIFGTVTRILLKHNVGLLCFTVHGHHTEPWFYSWHSAFQSLLVLCLSRPTVSTLFWAVCLPSSSVYLFICLLFWTDHVITVCHEQLTQSRWNLLGITINHYSLLMTWLDSGGQRS